MLVHLVIIVTALLASTLTFFSGFGLGTILLPALALFFPLAAAIVMTGVVHFINGAFKVLLLRRHIHFPTLWRFGLLAIPSAYLGAFLLTQMGNVPALYSYQWMERDFNITALKLVVGILMMSFTLLEILPGFKHISIHPRYLPVGGMISGFFGGLTGHQGAFRSMFLIRSGLTKEQFVATGAAFAFFVDLTRLGVYFSRIEQMEMGDNLSLLGLATLAALSGALLGNRLLPKVNLQFIRYLVASTIFILGLLISAGII
jgi:uncharacterized protein